MLDNTLLRNAMAFSDLIGLSYSHIPQSDIRQTDDPVFPESISLRLGAAIVSSQLVIIIVNIHNKPDYHILYFPRVFI